MNNMFQLSKKVNNAFGELMKSEDYGYIEVGIDFKENELIVVQSDGGMSKDDVFPSIKKILKPKSHQFFVVKDPFSDKNMFKIVHFGSDGSDVKTRMIFASAREPLKSYLGSSSFSEDFFFSSIDDCEISGLISSSDDLDVRTNEEKLAQEARDDVDVLPVTTQVIHSLPIGVDESAKVMAMKFKDRKVKAAIFKLGKNQSLNGEEIAIEEKVDESGKLKSIAARLNEVVEPRYVLFTFSHRKGKSNIFLYYCPEKADRNLKFTYSTCKINIVEFLKIAEIPVDLKLEETATDDITPKYLIETMSPKKTENTKFAKPDMPKRKRRGKTKKSKS